MATIFNQMFATDERGTFDFTLYNEEIAEIFGVTENELDAFFDALVALGLLGEDTNGLYDPEIRAEYEEVEEESYDRDWYTDEMQSYAWSCC